MTHSDKAWSVINELRETWCYGPCNYQEGCGCSDAIAAAIREAENAAYDKAIRAVQVMGSGWMNDDQESGWRAAEEAAINAIRQLKYKIDLPKHGKGEALIVDVTEWAKDTLGITPDDKGE